MISGIIDGATRFIGASADWDQGDGAIAGSLYLRDSDTEGFHTVTTAWFPSPEEMDRIRFGKPILVKLVGGDYHPGMTVEVQA